MKNWADLLQSQEAPRENPAVQLDIVIVGAGLSGLGVAVASALSGHMLTVYESATELREVCHSLVSCVPLCSIACPE